jgi:hypothetical protein
MTHYTELKIIEWKVHAKKSKIGNNDMSDESTHYFTTRKYTIERNKANK